MAITYFLTSSEYPGLSQKKKKKKSGLGEMMLTKDKDNLSCLSYISITLAANLPSSPCLMLLSAEDKNNAEIARRGMSHRQHLPQALSSR